MNQDPVGSDTSSSIPAVEFVVEKKHFDAETTRVSVLLVLQPAFLIMSAPKAAFGVRTRMEKIMKESSSGSLNNRMQREGHKQAKREEGLSGWWELGCQLLGVLSATFE